MRRQRKGGGKAVRQERDRSDEAVRGRSDEAERGRRRGSEEEWGGSVGAEGRQ